MQDRETTKEDRWRRNLDAAIDEIGRLRTAFRINMMRFGAKEEEINEVLYPHAKT